MIRLYYDSYVHFVLYSILRGSSDNCLQLAAPLEEMSPLFECAFRGMITLPPPGAQVSFHRLAALAPCLTSNLMLYYLAVQTLETQLEGRHGF